MQEDLIKRKKLPKRERKSGEPSSIQVLQDSDSKMKRMVSWSKTGIIDR